VGLLELQRSFARAAKLRSRRLLASMLRAQHDAPICTAACFAPSSAETLVDYAEKRRVWASEHAALAMQYARYAAMARSHTTTVNKFVAAAPESRGSKTLKKVLPWSPLGVLLAPSLELTTAIDKRGNNATVGALRLPPDSLSVTRLRVNNRSVAAPKNPTSLNTTKVLGGDQLVLRGLPHHIAAVCDSKNGRLVLCPPKDRKEELGARLRRERQSLLAFAERLACGLQRAGRARLALRENHRRSHAALVIQIEWAGHVALKLGQQLTVRRKELEAARATASTRTSSEVRDANGGDILAEAAETISTAFDAAGDGSTFLNATAGVSAATDSADVAVGSTETTETADSAGVPETTIVPDPSHRATGMMATRPCIEAPTPATALLGDVTATTASGALNQSVAGPDGASVVRECEAASAANRSSGKPLPTGAEDGAEATSMHASTDDGAEDLIADEAANLLAEVLGRRPRTQMSPCKAKAAALTPERQTPTSQGAAGVPVC